MTATMLTITAPLNATLEARLSEGTCVVSWVYILPIYRGKDYINVATRSSGLTLTHACPRKGLHLQHGAKTESRSRAGWCDIDSSRTLVLTLSYISRYALGLLTLAPHASRGPGKP